MFLFVFIFSRALFSVKTEGKLNEHTKDSKAIQIKLEIMYSESLSLVYTSRQGVLVDRLELKLGLVMKSCKPLNTLRKCEGLFESEIVVKFDSTFIPALNEFTLLTVKSGWLQSYQRKQQLTLLLINTNRSLTELQWVFWKFLMTI